MCVMYSKLYRSKLSDPFDNSSLVGRLMICNFKTRNHTPKLFMCKRLTGHYTVH